MRLTPASLFLATFAALFLVQRPPAQTAAQETDRLLVAISDLHFGVGRQQQAWHPMEDFRWGPEFRQFLDEVHRQGGGKTDLVIAGDAFELWQSLNARDCASSDLDAGCSEAEAVARLKAVVAAHGADLQAIGAFANAGDNRVVFVPGNHDAALLFPGVAQVAVGATRGKPGRVRVESGGYWLSPNGRVLVEHGHQMGREVNKLRGWPKPFIGADPVRLERSWGEQFVQEFYNQYEAKYPIIDNVSEESVGIRYAREVEGWLGTVRAAGRFVLFYVDKLSLWQRAGALGSQASTEWDIAAVKSAGDRFLAESVPSDDPLGRAVRQPGVDLSAGADEFSEDELRAICDARAQLHAYQLNNGVSEPTIRPCPVKNGTLGALAQAALRRTRETILREYLTQRYAELRKTAALSQPFKVFIHGHTHLADGGFRPMAASHPDWNPIVVNTGAWQRTATPPQLQELACRVAAGSSIIELHPDELPPCYTVVMLRPAAPEQPELRYWTADSAGTWRFDATCRWTQPCPKGP